MKNLSAQRMHFFMLMVALLGMPACSLLDYFKKDGAPVEQSAGSSDASMPAAAQLTGDVLATIDGKPAITVDMFEKEFNTLVESNQQIKALLPLMPDLQDRFFEGLLSQQLVDRYIAKNKIDQTEEYKQQLNDFLKQARQVINEMFFSKQFPANVSESEVRKYYDQNKANIPDLVISFGGVNTMGVEFANADEAKAFMEKVKGKAAQFEKIAKESGLASKFRDFKLVNAQSVGLDPAIRSKVVSITTFPSVELVKGNDKKEWVVVALNKEEAKYQDFDKVKEPLKAAVAQEKQNEVKMNELEKLKKEYNVEINKSYFDKKKDNQKNAQMEQLQEAIKQQAQAKPEAEKAPAKKARAA